MTDNVKQHILYACALLINVSAVKLLYYEENKA